MENQRFSVTKLLWQNPEIIDRLSKMKNPSKDILKKSEWISNFSKTDLKKWIQINDIKPSIKEGSVSFDFNDSWFNEKHNKWLVVKNCITDWKLDMKKFKAWIKKAVEDSINKMKK